ncbi:MAG: hypothetical protein LBB27_01625, partial [Tannerellaceae bacterium]|nr:hypothetical protein [Tannerellaceae bacterium]
MKRMLNMSDADGGRQGYPVCGSKGGRALVAAVAWAVFAVTAFAQGGQYATTDNIGNKDTLLILAVGDSVQLPAPDGNIEWVIDDKQVASLHPPGDGYSAILVGLKQGKVILKKQDKDTDEYLEDYSLDIHVVAFSLRQQGFSDSAVVLLRLGQEREFVIEATGLPDGWGTPEWEWHGGLLTISPNGNGSGSAKVTGFASGSGTISATLHPGGWRVSHEIRVIEPMDVYAAIPKGTSFDYERHFPEALESIPELGNDGFWTWTTPDEDILNMEDVGGAGYAKGIKTGLARLVRSYTGRREGTSVQTTLVDTLSVLVHSGFEPAEKDIHILFPNDRLLVPPPLLSGDIPDVSWLRWEWKLVNEEQEVFTVDESGWLTGKTVGNAKLRISLFGTPESLTPKPAAGEISQERDVYVPGVSDTVWLLAVGESRRLSVQGMEGHLPESAGTWQWEVAGSSVASVQLPDGEGDCFLLVKVKGKDTLRLYLKDSEETTYDNALVRKSYPLYVSGFRELNGRDVVPILQPGETIDFTIVLDSIPPQDIVGGLWRAASSNHWVEPTISHLTESKVLVKMKVNSGASGVVHMRVYLEGTEVVLQRTFYVASIVQESMRPMSGVPAVPLGGDLAFSLPQISPSLLLDGRAWACSTLTDETGVGGVVSF